MLPKLWMSLLVLCLVLSSADAPAQFPERPIRVIIPFAPGGNIDVTARVVAPVISELLGRTLIMDNRSGAGGSVGAEIVARANPDGYTLLFGSTGLLSIAPVISERLPYDPIRSFEPIILVSRVPLVMLVNGKSSVASVSDFISVAKGREGLTQGSSGTFSTGQLAGILFQSATGTRLLHVPYKSGGAALVDLVGGQIDVMFEQVNSATVHIQTGRLRPLAITATSRSSSLPDVPTMPEAGLPAVEAETFNAVLAPARTPASVIRTLNDAANRALGVKAVREGYARQGAEVMGGTPESAAAHIRSELAKWTKVIRSAGLKPDTP